MSSRFIHGLIHVFHALCWCVIGVAFLIVVGVGILAYGFDGKRIQPYLDNAIPAELGKLSIRHFAYRLGQGIVLEGVRFEDPQGKILGACSKLAADFQLLTTKPLLDRLSSITCDDLFVAQIEHEPNKPKSHRDDPHDPLPDLSQIPLPKFENVALTLHRPSILDVRVKRFTGSLDTHNGAFLFRNIRCDIDGQNQYVDASITVDLREAVIDTHIRGRLFQQCVNGVYRALDFPIIETYSNKFTLEEPAWADCTFKVGLDKYRNIFNFRIDIAVTKGDYCGVAFDEAQGTIRCNGVWDAVTVIDPLIMRRNGVPIASGVLRFDCPADRFEFETTSDGLTPMEALQLIDMPFTQAIPPMVSETPPDIYFRGHIPLLTEQSPERVVLNGSITSETPFTFDKITLKSTKTLLSMQQGVFSIDSLKGEFPHGGSVDGRVDISIPETALYTDILANVTLEKASLADLLQPFQMEMLTNCVATGSVSFACRTDETFKSSVNTDFDLTIDGGLIGRIPLFAGFTDIIADNIPGISTLTDTSVVKLKGSSQNGVFFLPHFNLSGSLFTIEGPVTYHLPNDKLHAKIIAGVFKKNTVVGTLTRWATVPITKMLWEIEVTGPIAKPKWQNQTLLNKLWEHTPFHNDEEETH